MTQRLQASVTLHVWYQSFSHRPSCPFKLDAAQKCMIVDKEQTMQFGNLCGQCGTTGHLGASEGGVADPVCSRGRDARESQHCKSQHAAQSRPPSRHIPESMTMQITFPFLKCLVSFYTALTAPVFKVLVSISTCKLR